MSLINLIYASSAVSDLKLVDLEQILEASVRNNKPCDITGMLLYVGGGFLQALEGEESAVTAMYRKIESDPRHQSIVVIDSSPIESRSFPTWSMGFKYLGVEDSSKREAVRNLINNGFSSVTRDVKPGAALAMLREFST
jgi:hypothetical protein